MKKKLSATFDEVFGFLNREYHFEPISVKDENWGYLYLGKNTTTGIEITFEIREGYIKIKLYKLVNGDIIENTVTAIKEEKDINGFSLDQILQLKSPDALTETTYAYNTKPDVFVPDDGLKNYAMLFAYNLNKYAGDVLSGDFVVFEQLEKIAKIKNK